MLQALMLAVALVSAPAADYTGLVFLESPGCRPCREMRPAVERLLVEGHAILVVSVETTGELGEYGASATPTTIAYDRGRETARRIGVLDEAALRAMLHGSAWIEAAGPEPPHPKTHTEYRRAGLFGRRTRN